MQFVLSFGFWVAPVAILVYMAYRALRTRRAKRIEEERLYQEHLFRARGVTILPRSSLVQHYLTVLRNKRSGPENKRRALHKLSRMLLEKAGEDAPCNRRVITTSMEEPAVGYDARRVVVISILRAALGMFHAANEVFPRVSHGILLVQRDEKTGDPDPKHSYIKLPPKVADGTRIILNDPMLATGGSMSLAIKIIKLWLERLGVKNATITIACAISAPEGLDRIMKEHPDVHIVVAAVDRELTAEWYISGPGAGDVGDEIMGTVEKVVEMLIAA